MQGSTGAHVVVKGAVEDDVNAPPVAKRLWAHLVCLCGGCQRETLLECRCGQAANERTKILGMLEGMDLSTPAKEQAAYDQVVQAYVARYGGYHVLATPPDSGFNKLSWALPYATFFATIVIIGLVVRGWVRRGKSEIARAAQEPLPAAGPREYEDRLDDELDEMD
jgi:cytochrome c-type biogenesis protein CcmF